MQNRIDLQLPAKMRAFLEPARYKVAYGGRGSAKSESIGRILVMQATQERCRILCCREFQNSIRVSVHALLRAAIAELQMGAFFDINHTSIRCKPTGTEFLFQGLYEHTVDSIKSLHGVKYAWVEEAQTISRRSMDLLLPTIRAQGSQIYFSYNPELDTDPVHNRFVVNPDPAEDAIVIKMNWEDNPWFPDVLNQERLACMRRSLEDYAHIWEGQTRQFTKASILGHLVKVQAFEPEPGWTPHYGIDWGFANDPTTCARVFYANRKIYIRNEFYGHGVEINEYHKCFSSVPGAREHELWADNARPESISFLNNPRNAPDGRPLKVKPAPKWSGSVEDGIAWLRSVEAIIVHPDCTNAAHELVKWSWKTDKQTGAILPVPAEGNDHIPDAVRYALSLFIKKKVTMFDIM